MYQRLYQKIGQSLGQRIVTPGTKLNQIPLKSDALFWLDGVIIDDGGTKYFRDKSGNNRRFLITGYDFDSTWVAGMPYKSAATISAPAADAALIAADINNYLYDSGGTPNQIPVVSLFHDIDYEHKLFCRHIAQELDGNGVETSEPRVVDIVLYNNVKATTDLTICQSYFEVPVEITSNVKWVSKTGNDTTGNGSKANPWLTIQKANNSATASDTVYVKTGVYTEQYSEALKYLWTSNTLTYKSIGKCEVNSLDTNRVVYLVSGDVNFSGFIIDGKLAKPNGVVFYGNNNKNTVFQKCYITGATTLTISGGQAVEINTSITNCIFKGSNSYASQRIISKVSLIDTSYFSNTYVDQLGNLEFINNKFAENSKTYCISIQDKELTAKGNTFNYSGYCITNSIAYTSAKTFSIKYNTFKQGQSSGVKTSAISIATAALDITDNKFISTTTTSASTSQLFIEGTAVVESALIKRNIFSSLFKGYFPHIYLKGAASDNAIEITHNYHKSNSQTGVIVTLGNETTESAWHNGAIYSDNRVIGFKVDYPLDSDSTVHGVLLNAGKDMIITRNKITHCTLGLIVKTGTQQAYTSGGVFYNLFEDNKTDIWIRGVSGLNVFNNTLKHSNINYAEGFDRCIFADENSANAGDQFSENIIIKNNIISGKAGGYLVGLDAHAAANGCVVENNVMYGGSYVLRLDATLYSDIADAQAVGWCDDCSDSDPLLSDLLIPATSISGIDLGVNYDDGLDISTNWGTNTTVPVVVTKQQGVTWQKGAYLQ